MSARSSLRRPAMGLAGLTLVVGGTLGAVSVAGAEPASPSAELPTVALHNATAETGTDCPSGGAAYWHFVFAPNNDVTTFELISLNLGDGANATFSGSAIVPNGTQTDNVFVAVPAGHQITDLQLSGSFAAYSGQAPNLFNLSHVCEGVVPEQETTTTTTEADEETTTTTTEADEETTTTTTEADEETTTTTTEPAVVDDTTVDTTVDDTTVDTTVDDTTVEDPAPSVEPIPETVPADVTPATAVTASGTLPYTGSEWTGLAIAGFAVVAGGALLTAAARNRTNAARR